MTLSPFCLSSAALPAHKGKSPPGRGCFDNSEECVAGTRHGGRDAKGFYHYASETQNVRGQLCSTSAVLGWVKAGLFFQTGTQSKQQNENKLLSDQSTVSFLHYQGRAKASSFYLLLKLSSHLDITTALTATARCSQSQGVFKQTAKQTRTSISSFSEYTASRVLLDCGETRSQEKIIIKSIAVP